MKLLDNLIKWIDSMNKERDFETTVLDDGSAFFAASYPLPKDHWLYSEPKYSGAPRPFLKREDDRRKIYEAAKWAIREATDCGKIIDFDPDALVQCIVYAMTGPSGQVVNVQKES
jgi:hypothetical protein